MSLTTEVPNVPTLSVIPFLDFHIAICGTSLPVMLLTYNPIWYPITSPLP